MLALQLLAAVLVLLVVVALGVVAHELLHAAVLHAAGASYELRLFAGERGDGPSSALAGSWASVRVLAVPAGTSHWWIRAASLSPLLLALPVVLVPTGVVPDPFAAGDVVGQAAVLGVLACALPSPADFALVWEPESVVADADRAA